VRARLFVALDLPDAVVEALVAWRGPQLPAIDGMRAVAPAALHVTLCFLGARAEEAIAPLAALVAASAAAAGGCGGLALGEPLWLPRRRPRVLAVTIEDRHGQLGRLHEDLVWRLATDGWHERGSERAYLPHVTVARVRGRTATPRGALALGPPPLVFDGAAVTLYRSRLGPGGSRYEPLSVSRLA
jgi:2'-5' RNA ligase